MNAFKRALKEPLLHFLAAGLVLFLLFEAVSPESAGLSEKVIVVDRNALLTHIQYRIKSFEPRAAAERLAALKSEELKHLTDEYVREEALYREALALGMDSGDYIIKRRLIQKIEFLAQGFADADIHLSEDDLEAYLRENREDYLIEPAITFTHVFFDAEKRGAVAARAAAARKLLELNAGAVAFADAPRHGDRFLYHLNYVERTPDFVAGHFGRETVREIFTAPVSNGIWRGPFDSPHGSHLLLITRSEPARNPELDEIRERVADDARRAGARNRLKAAIAEIVADYEVRMTYQPEARQEAALAGEVIR
ncbi:MAG: peptidylprolyl isomerase [Acidobacteriota bacterium]|nr:peptidylprolyl isomerase [Acidobacteriota bacterium]